MNWLARLKKMETVHETDAAKPIQSPTTRGAPAANDPAPDRLRAASMAMDAVIAVAGMAADPDRWCYPYSAAMNTKELDRFAARLARFTDRGLTQGHAERLADRLLIRDREQDDRRTCLECTHLGGAGAWRCGNWARADVAIRSRDAQLPGDLVRTLQRCNGFKGA